MVARKRLGIAAFFLVVLCSCTSAPKARPRLVCTIGQAVCNGQCYNPAGGLTCLGGTTLCPVGDKLCNGQCYNPVGQTCH